MRVQAACFMYLTETVSPQFAALCARAKPLPNCLTVPVGIAATRINAWLRQCRGAFPACSVSFHLIHFVNRFHFLITFLLFLGALYRPCRVCTLVLSCSATLREHEATHASGTVFALSSSCSDFFWCCATLLAGRLSHEANPNLGRRSQTLSERQELGFLGL